MNLVSTAPVWLLIILAVLLTAAAAEDVTRLRISNAISAGVLVAGLIAMAHAGLTLGLYQNFVVCIAILAIGTFLFSAGHVGGGDVKLLAAVGLWVNFAAALWLLAAVFIAGGVLALVVLASRPLQRKRVSRAKDRGRQVPYGVAIALGAAVLFSSQLGMWGHGYQKPNPFAVRPLR